MEPSRAAKDAAAKILPDATPEQLAEAAQIIQATIDEAINYERMEQDLDPG